jgi:hypothetical protein
MSLQSLRLRYLKQLFQTPPDLVLCVLLEENHANRAIF